MSEPGADLSGAKRRILDRLKRADTATAPELAAEFGLTDTAIRQHLEALQTAELVERVAAASTGRGRPPVHWRLTPIAHTLFADRHADLTVDLISSIREALGEDALEQVVRARAERQVATYRAALGESGDTKSRVHRLAELRNAEGYLAEVVDDDDHLTLVEHHCPIQGAAQSCSGLCNAELVLFQEALGPGVSVVREQHLLAGDQRCSYRVTPALGLASDRMADLFVGGVVDPVTHQRTDALVQVPSGDLTTHGVIVGMTGSGKTGLGIVLVEEVLAAGIPALLIDPKGDLTNLCLTFPDLAAGDFEPWVNEGDAAKAGQTVAEFAATQAAAWSEGLAGWGVGADRLRALRDATTFTVYTPGSTAGVGIDIIGSLDAPPDGTDSEIVGDEIEGFVGGLLSLVDVDADPLSSREHILLSNLVHHEWAEGRDLDLATLVGMVMNPPIRKLGVFDLDQFFPPKERQAFAMRLNGLLASPSFASWMSGDPLDIDAMLHTPDGRPRCAIVTTAHLSDQERQFVTTLVLGKLVTWMRRQSGTTDLRALLYMDEVAGYLPPTAAPPTKKPIMTLMKQARAFGVGVVLCTQNPVDVDYKALSNAGTWMIGRLQTERDKQRLLDGMSAATGGVDVAAVGDTISGLAKREFVLRRAGKDRPEVFTTRWAMSYLRGPLTRDQIAALMAEQKQQPVVAPSEPAPSAPTSSVPAADTPVAPEIAAGVAVRWADPAAPWLGAVGGDPRGTHWSAGVVARVALRYDETKADLIHDEEYESVLFPLVEQIDVTTAVAADYDERDLHQQPFTPLPYVLPDAQLSSATYFRGIERGLVDHLVRSRTLQILANRQLKLYSRPGESPEAFGQRCFTAADDQADAATAALRNKYQSRVETLRGQLEAAQDRAEVLEAEHKGRRNQEIFSTAGSILDGIFGGRRSRGSVVGSVLGKAGTAAGRRGRSDASSERVHAAENKIQHVQEQIADLESDLTADVMEIDAKWMAIAKDITTIDVPLERSDVSVTHLALVWIPVS